MENMHYCANALFEFIYMHSQLFLDGHPYKMDTSVRRHLVLIRAVYQSFYCNYTLHKTVTSLRRTKTDNWEVLYVAKNTSRRNVQGALHDSKLQNV